MFFSKYKVENKCHLAVDCECEKDRFLNSKQIFLRAVISFESSRHLKLGLTRTDFNYVSQLYFSIENPLCFRLIFLLE